MSAKLTVQQLNDIQSAWMNLCHNAPIAEKRRVFKLMEGYPKSFLSVSSDRQFATPFVNNSPCWAESRPIGEAIKLLRSPSIYNGRTDIGWCGAIGAWVSI